MASRRGSAVGRRRFEILCEVAGAEGWAVELHVSTRVYHRLIGGQEITYRLPSRIDVWDEGGEQVELLASRAVNGGSILLDLAADKVLSELAHMA